jgi:CRISPR-associated protein Cmr6
MHAGLWMDRYFVSGVGDTSAKAAHIESLARIEVPEGYRTALAVRDDTMQAMTGNTALRFDLRFPKRLAAGLGFRGVLEAGLSLDHTWGTPVVEGSSLKGAARAACSELDGVEWEPVEEPDPAAKIRGAHFRTLFGAKDNVGTVAFHDAWWVPEEDSSTLPIRPDVMTPHHPKHYGGGSVPPDGTDDPIPVPFAVVAHATFRFWLTGDPEWCSVVELILRHALHSNGVGAKTDSGYGRTAAEDAPGAEHYAPV